MNLDRTKRTTRPDLLENVVRHVRAVGGNHNCLSASDSPVIRRVALMIVTVLVPRVTVAPVWELLPET
jgi:hypothetical protein